MYICIHLKEGKYAKRYKKQGVYIYIYVYICMSEESKMRLWEDRM